MGAKTEMSSQGKRTNGCIKTDCIVPLPCPNKHPPKTEDGFCIYYNNGTKKSSIEGEERSQEETASFHYDLGELHKKVRDLEASINQIKKDIYKIKEVIDNFHGTYEYSPFDED
jgi:hypothetical protein